MFTKKTWATVLFIFPIFFVGTVPGLSLQSKAFAANDEIRIGFVDMQTAVLGTKEWKRQSLNFKKDLQKQKIFLEGKESKLKTMYEEIKKQSFVLNDELKKKKQEDFRDKKKEFERFVQDVNDDFSRKEKEIKNQIVVKMMKIVRKLGEERKYTMVIEKTALFYASKDEDLTSAAILAYDKTHK